MKATGVVVGLIDVPHKHTSAYNRWYDFDHLPEFVALPEVVLGRRYVAPPELKVLREPSPLPEFADGRGTYCTTYLLGSHDLYRAERNWRVLADRLYKERRIFRYGKIADVGFFALEQLQVRSDIPVVPEAIPYLGHTGIFTVFTRVADPDRRAEVNDWFREVHAPDLLDVRGVVAAMRFSRFHGPDEGRYLNVYLLDGDPAEMVKDLRDRRPDWEARGRSPSPGRASEILFQSAYRAVVPTQYEFRVE